MPWRTEDLALRVVLARQPDRGRVGSIAHEPHGGEYMVGRTWRRFGYLEHKIEKHGDSVARISYRCFQGVTRRICGEILLMYLKGVLKPRNFRRVFLRWFSMSIICNIAKPNVVDILKAGIKTQKWTHINWPGDGLGWFQTKNTLTMMSTDMKKSFTRP